AQPPRGALRAGGARRGRPAHGPLPRLRRAGAAAQRSPGGAAQRHGPVRHHLRQARLEQRSAPAPPHPTTEEGIMKTHDAGPMLVALLALAGCGSTGVKPGDLGGDAGAPDAGNPTVVTCGDPNAPIDPTAALDDMEDGNFLILQVGGRNGAWWAGG